MSAEVAVVYVIIGALAGYLASTVLRTRRNRGFSLVNTLIGILGAVIGYFLFYELLDFTQADFGFLGEIGFTAADLLVAFIGAVLLIFVARLARNT
jgi:uncharacterized membrane protein YeaQ/YmgE (transglycosylase-associated protein family)